MRPAAVIAVDWSATSGRTRPGENTIHLAEATAAGVGPAVHLPTRHALIERLAQDLTARAGPMLVVFDVSFGWPAGAARHVTGSDDPLVLWDWMATALTDGPDGRNDRFEVAARLNGLLPGEGPFWGRPPGRDVPGLAPTKPAAPVFREWRAAEGAMRAAGGLAGRPKSVWQLAYTGSVGSQTLTAMAALARLRRRLGNRCAVWPFQSADAPVVLAEVYLAHADGAAPLWRGEGPKDAGQVRAMAAGLFGALNEGADLFAAPPPVAAEEGWVLGIGHEAAIDRHARGGGAVSGLRPPPLADDCFALPPGVDWADMDDALARLRASVRAVTPPETVALELADGRVLAEDVRALRSSPPGANAAVDGWGFAHAAVADPAAIPVEPGRSAAGAPHGAAVPPGRALRILTGALLPEGVDTVALQEDAVTDGARLALAKLPTPGANTRPAGEDVAAGAPILPARRVLTPADLALLAATGHGTAPVRARLAVGVLSTGDELREPGAEAPPHATYDANGPMLTALARRWGHEAVPLGRAPDDQDALRAALDGAAARCGAVLTSGGASAGEEDHLSALMRAEGHVETWRIAIKPGRPLMLGTWRGVPVFGLPGNPVAAFVCALIFARPALAALSGAAWPEPAGLTVPAAFAKRKKAGRREFLRARLRGGRAEAFASEGSGRVSGLSWADGLIALGPEAREIAPGDPVTYLPFTSFGL